MKGAATSGQAKGVVASFADGVLLKEQFVKLTELDVSYWAYWLSTCGYSSKVGAAWRGGRVGQVVHVCTQACKCTPAPACRRSSA